MPELELTAAMVLASPWVATLQEHGEIVTWRQLQEREPGTLRVELKIQAESGDRRVLRRHLGIRVGDMRPQHRPAYLAQALEDEWRRLAETCGVAALAREAEDEQRQARVQWASGGWSQFGQTPLGKL